MLYPARDAAAGQHECGVRTLRGDYAAAAFVPARAFAHWRETTRIGTVVCHQHGKTASRRVLPQQRGVRRVAIRGDEHAQRTGARQRQRDSGPRGMAGVARIRANGERDGFAIDVKQPAAARAIALWGARRTEEELLAIDPIARGAYFSASYAHGTGVVGADEVQRGAAYDAQIGRTVIFAGAMGVFAELHIQHPMLLVLNAPVFADSCGNAGRLLDGTQASPARRFPVIWKAFSLIQRFCRSSQYRFFWQ